MGTGLRFRGDRGVDINGFDWVTPAEELEVPLDEARAFYEEALRQAMYPGSRPAKEIYLEWLAAWESGEPLSDPGRHALTMRLGQQRRREPVRRSRVPGKRPLTAHLAGPRPRPAEARDAAQRGRDHREARPAGEAYTRGFDLFLGRGGVAPGGADELAHEPAHAAEAAREPSWSWTLLEGGAQGRPSAARVPGHGSAADRFHAPAASALGFSDGQQPLPVELARGSGDSASAVKSSVDGNVHGGSNASSPAADIRPTVHGDGTIDPGHAFVGLAVHTAIAAVRRSLTATATRLAARAQDGGPARLEKRDDVLSAIHAAAEDPGAPLPDAVLERFERELDRHLGHARVHTGAAAARAAHALGARAFTFGSHIYFADGELAPGTERGDRLLRHELTHVIQHSDGRLRPHGSGLEIEAHDGDAEIEARAAESAPSRNATAPMPAQASSAGASPTPPQSQAAGTAPTPTPAADARGVIAGDWFSDRRRDLENVASGVGDAVGSVGNAIGDAVSDVASWGASQFMEVVRQFSPELATLIESGPSAVVGENLQGVLIGLLGGLIPGNPLSALVGFGADLLDVASILVGAARGDASCCATFASWCSALGAFARSAATSDVAQQFRSAFMALDGAVGGVIRFFGGALTESFRGQLMFLETMGSWITQAISDIGTFLQPAVDWVLEQLGLPSVAEIGTWLQGLADAAWQAIKDLVSGALAVLRELGPQLLALSGLGPLIEAMRFSFQLIEVTDWLIAHRNDPDLVRNAREQMAHTFLPKLLEGMGGLVGQIQSAIAWVESHLVEIAIVITGVALIMTGVLAPIGIALLACAAAVRALWPVIGPALHKLWVDLQALLARFYEFARPVIDTLTQIIVIGVSAANPFALTVIVASSAWLLLPECFKAPILNLILDVMIAGLEFLPPSSVIFGLLWRYVRAGAISFLTDVRNNWSDDDKVTVINRIARMGSGRSTEMMAGFVVGFFKGVVAGVIDPFKMIYELLKAGWELSVFFSRLVNHAPELAPVIQRHLPALQERAQEIMASGQQALNDFLAGRIGFDDLWQLITSFADYLETQAAALGVTASQRIKTWLLGADTEYSFGEALGIAVGFIIVFALILYFSGGQFATAKGVIGVVHQIAKVLNLPFELLGAALRPLATLFRPVLEVLAAVGSRLGLTQLFRRAMAAFEGFVNTLGRLVEDLLLAIEARVIGRTAEELAIILGRRIGVELAERLVTELGGAAAERLVARLGEANMARLGALTSQQLLALSLRVDEALVTRMLDAGLSAQAIERLGMALERATVDALLGRGLTGAQLERLATLSTERLTSLTETALSRLGALPEAEFSRLAGLGDDAFRRMIALPEAQLNRFLGLGDDVFGRFAALDDAAFARFAALDDAALARFAALDDAAFARFAALDDAAFARFAALDETAFARFTALDDAAFARFAALDDAALARFAALDETAFARFTALDDAAFARFAALDETAFARFTALDDAAFARFTALDDAAFARFAALDDAAFARFTALDDAAFARFAALPEAAFGRYAGLADDVFAKFAALDATGIERFGALSDAAFAKFAALDAPMLQSFAALDVETLRSFAFFDDAVLRKFGSVPPADLAKLAGIDTIALRDFAAMDANELRTLLANHSAEDIRILGNMTPERWAESHASAQSLDAAGGHSFAKHGAQTTIAQQETRLRTGVAPDGSSMSSPPTAVGRFASDAAQVEAARVAEIDLYNNMVRTNGRLKRGYVKDVPVPGAGFSYHLDPPGVPPPPYLGGRVVETISNRVHAAWELNSAGTDYILITMYPIP